MAGWLRPGERGGWRALAAVLCLALARSYNVDLDHAVLYQGPNGSFFGYSVLEHSHDSTRW